MTGSPQRVQDDWISIGRAPFIFRRNTRRGKRGNYYFVSGRTDEWLTKGIEETGIPASAGTFPFPPGFELEKIVSASINREYGTFLLNWFPDAGPYHQHVWPQEIADCHERATAFLASQNIPNFSQVHRDLVKEACENLTQTWHYMLDQFHWAIRAGVCSIVARVGSPLAPEFTELAYDMFRRYQIVDWRHGDAEATDGSKIFSMYAVPGKIETARSAPSHPSEEDAAGVDEATARRRAKANAYDEALRQCFPEGVTPTIQTKTIISAVWLYLEGKGLPRAPLEDSEAHRKMVREARARARHRLAA